jgi:hypothetical protein
MGKNSQKESEVREKNITFAKFGRETEENNQYPIPNPPLLITPFVKIRELVPYKT